MLEPKMIEPTPLVTEPVAEPAKAPEPAKTAEPTAAEPAKEPAKEAPKAEEAKVEEKKPAASLLTEAEPPKKEEAKAPDDKKVEDGKAAEPAEPEAIKYEPFKVPEGVKLGEEETNKFTGILGKHRVSQEAAQEIIDLYVSEAQRLPELQRDVWQRTQEQWKDSVRADPELGGNRIDTVLKTGSSVIERFGGSADEKAKLRQALTLTGAGNHPEIIRFFYRVGKALAEPSPVPAPTPKTAPAAQSRAERRYAKE